MKKFIFIIAFLPAIVYAQNIQYAHKVIDTLASKTMAGRAYCTKGNQLAAQYISDQLKQFHVKPFGTNYFQTFYLSKNCILDSVYFFAGTKYLHPGVSYIIEGTTPSITGNFEIKFVRRPAKWQKLARKRNLDTKFVVVDYKKIQKLKKNKKQILSAFEQNRMDAAGVIILKDNFYYYIRPKQSFFPLIYVKPSAFPQNTRSISINVHATLHDSLQTQNIIGYIPGQIDSFIVFTAHYDHLGRLGQIYFPGANDNASGDAMLLDLAHTFSNRKTPPKYNIAFIFFSGEELGLLGSIYYVEHPVFDLHKIKLLINLDMVGSGDQGITIVNGKELGSVVHKMQQINQQMNLLPNIKVRPNAPNSDHYPFTLMGVPAIFIYTRGQYKQYHNIFDRANLVPLSKFVQLEQLLYQFVETY